MKSLLENAALLLLITTAAVALMRLQARRYLLVLVVATTIGGWVIGYGFGARDVSDSLQPLLRPDSLVQATSIAQADLVSPLWGFALGALIILMDILVFRKDIRGGSKTTGADEAGD